MILRTIPRAGGGFDPDVPLDYFTMTDSETGEVVVIVVESGVLVVLSALTTEAGDVLTTETGAPLTTEG